MKNLQSSLGAGTKPAGSDEAGLIKALVVRNLGQYGRRVAIYTEEGELVMGSKLHAADYQFNPTEAPALDGYTAGQVVELAAKRNYVEIFSFEAPATFDYVAHYVPGAQHARLSSAVTHGLEEAVPYNPATAESDFPLGDLAIDATYLGRTMLSFTIEVDDVPHDIAFDASKHPARQTADINYQLAAIHPQLRGYVALASDYQDQELPVWSLYFSEPAGVQVRFPLTDYTVETLEPTGNGEGIGFGYFQALHLNNRLETAVEIISGEVENYEAEILTDPRVDQVIPVADMIAQAIKMPSEINYDGETLTNPVALGPSHFHYLPEDTRFKVALVELSPEYNNGDILYLEQVKLSGGGQYADLLVVEGTRQDGSKFGTRLIDLDASLTAGKLVGTSLVNTGADANQALIGKGTINAGLFGSRLAIAVIAPAENNGRFAPMFRESTGDIVIDMDYTRDYVETPTLRVINETYEWEKDAEIKAPVAFTMSEIPGAKITKVTATHTSGTIVEENPIVNTADGITTVEFNDGFARSELTIGQTSGRITIDVDLEREAENKSAKTNLKYHTEGDYVVVLPTPAPVMNLETIREFVRDQESLQEVTFTGKIVNDGEAPRFPSYYFKTLALSADVSGNIEIGGQSVIVNDAVGNDEEYTFTVTFTKGALSALEAGIHSLNITGQVEYEWGTATTLTASAQFEILPEVEGVEDDVSFITPSWFDHETTSVMEDKGTIRIIDLDSGEVLAEGNSYEILMADAEAKGLVEVNMIYGKEIEAVLPPLEISCEGALPDVTLGLAGGFDVEINDQKLGAASNVYELGKILAVNDLSHDVPQFDGEARAKFGIRGSDVTSDDTMTVVLDHYGDVNNEPEEQQEFTGKISDFFSRQLAPTLEWFDVDGVMVPSNSTGRPVFAQFRIKVANNLSFENFGNANTFQTEDGEIVVHAALSNVAI